MRAGEVKAGEVKEGQAAAEAIAESARRTIGRQQLARHERFDAVSPDVGELDEQGFDELMRDDEDGALSMLADLTSATDERLRALARRLAGQVLVELATRGARASRGVGRLRTRPLGSEVGDLDLDASIEPVAIARAGGRGLRRDEMHVRVWERPDTAICLLVDRSGSMTGRPLATAALASAAVALRSAGDYSVVAFAADAVVAKSQGTPRPPEAVVTDVLALRGHGTTDLALALETAAAQLGRSPAARRITVLLSDCRATVPGDPLAAASRLDELVVIAPGGDDVEAQRFADATGARLATVDGPAAIPEALSRVL